MKRGLLLQCNEAQARWPKSKPADVLILPSWYYPMGGEFCRDQALALTRSGLRADVLAPVLLPWRAYSKTLFFDSWKAQLWDDEGVLTYRKFFRRLPFFDRPNIVHWARFAVLCFEEYEKLFGRPRVIHAHSSTWAGYAAFLLYEKYGIPYVLTEHRGIFGMKSELAANSFKSIYTPFLQAAFSNAQVILSVSDQLVPKIGEYLTHEVPIEVLSNMVDTSFFVPSKAPKVAHPFRFITMNSYRDVKGYDILLPAFDAFCHRLEEEGLNSKVELWIAGDGFENRDFQRILCECDFRAEIHFLGWLSSKEIREKLYESNAFVLASRVESQSIAVLEALSTGLPVVCTEVVPEAIIGSAQGLRVPVEEVKAFSEALFQMYHMADNYNPEELSAHVEQLASPQHVISSLKGIYSKL
ncbi:MAG: glycosyltransferase [Bacteroidaceae bacterium]